MGRAPGKPEGTDLRTIPGVGENMARHLRDIGYMTVESLKGQDAEEIYRKDCVRQGCRVDRCALYVYRLAVYFSGGGREPEKLKWWNWKDGGDSRGEKGEK